MDIIVPVKRFAHAKTRLSDVLSAPDREQLAELLALTVIKQLSGVRSIRRVIVASSEPRLETIAKENGFDLLLDDQKSPSLNRAIGNAVSLSMQGGATDIGVLFSDLPLFSAAEFDEILKSHLAGAACQVTLVCDRFGVGTNVRLCRPGDLLPPLYGRDSAREYQKAALARGAQLNVVRSDRLSHDLDQPKDIGAILDLPISQTLPPAIQNILRQRAGGATEARRHKCA